MGFQENGTIRIVKNLQGGYRVVLQGMDGRQYNVITGVGDLGTAVQVAANKAAFNGFEVLAYHEGPIAYWCRKYQLGQYQIEAHSIVEAKEIAAKANLDPSDVATTPDSSLPTFRAVLK